MGKITIFFKENCGHCKRAKELLAAKHVPYEGIDTDGVTTEWKAGCSRA